MVSAEVVGSRSSNGAGHALLEIEGLRTEIAQRHGAVRAVDGVSLSLRTGETVGLVGESGCGKTMTGMSIMGLLPPGGRIAAGSIRLLGRELTTLSRREMRAVRGSEVAMVFQDPMTSLNPCMTIGAQIAESVRAKLGSTKSGALARAAEMLALVGMPRPKERLGEYPHQLSGGLRQRVMIAIALACEPKLLIADEPTTALDVTVQAQILTLLDDLKTQLGMGMLLITHDMGIIAGRADRVVVMYGGRVAEVATTSDLFTAPHHPYTDALLASVPRPDQDPSEVLHSIPGLPPDLTDPPPGCRFAPRCGRVTGRCRFEDPVLSGNDPSHLYACFNPVDELQVRLVASGIRNASPIGHAVDDEALLVLDHVVKEFPVTAGILRRRVGAVHAVSDVSLTVLKGETFGLVGESGCGKTTLGRLMTALEQPDGGSIRFLGTDMASLHGGALRRHRRDFQLMFQDPYSSLDPRMRVGPTLREPLAIHKTGSRRAQQDQIARLLQEVGLDPKVVQYYPHEFSGGQRQRIGFARALTLSPKLIVADEPVSALDVSIRAQILNLMKRLQETHDLSYVVISHDLSVVRYLADRIGVMYLGKLVEVGPSAEVYERPAHPYTLGLLNAIPLADPTRERAKGRPVVVGELPSARTPPSGCRFRTRCPLAQEICAIEEPPLRSFDAGGHQAACHFPLQPPLAVAGAPSGATR